MITLLGRIFIKDYRNYENPTVRRAYGILAGIVGIGFNVVLFIGKYFAGMISGSIAIKADAFNNLSDAGSSFITLAGFRFAGMKADKEHPFGHGRFEYISGFVVSMAILLMGFELLQASAGKILHPSQVEMEKTSVLILLFSIGVKIYMSVYNYATGKKIDSSAMRAAGMDSLSDAVSTGVVLISGLASKYLPWNIDGFCGVLVAFFVLYTGYGAARETISPLLGRAPSKEFVEKIKEIVMENEEIVGIHDLIVHDYGPGRVIISLHGEVNGEKDVFVLHDAIDRIERELGEKLGCEAVIHMDPVSANDERANGVKAEVEKIVLELDSRLSIHDFRMVAGPTHTNLIFDILVPYGFEMADAQIEKAVREKISRRWENYNAVVKVDKSYV